MNEAIEELKENEFKDLYETENSTESKNYVKEFSIDTDLELLFPDEYINQVSERLNLYNELSELKTEEELQQYEQRLTDRFGALPRQAKSLLDSLRIKWIATEFGIEKIILKQNKMVAYFVGDQQSDYYQTTKFRKVLTFVQQNPTLGKMKEKETRNGLRLLLSFENIKSMKRALEVLSLMRE